MILLKDVEIKIEIEITPNIRTRHEVFEIRGSLDVYDSFEANHLERWYDIAYGIRYIVVRVSSITIFLLSDVIIRTMVLFYTNRIFFAL